MIPLPPDLATETDSVKRGEILAAHVLSNYFPSLVRVDGAGHCGSKNSGAPSSGKITEKSSHGRN